MPPITICVRKGLNVKSRAFTGAKSGSDDHFAPTFLAHFLMEPYFFSRSDFSLGPDILHLLEHPNAPHKKFTGVRITSRVGEETEHEPAICENPNCNNRKQFKNITAETTAVQTDQILAEEIADENDETKSKVGAPNVQYKNLKSTKEALRM